MKKICFLLVLLICSVGLFAQSGLFNLSYAIPAAEADSILNFNGFQRTDSLNHSITYTPKDNTLISALIAFIEPTTNRMIGWFIKYSPANTEENDDFVMQTLQQLHGKTNHYDVETKQLIWFLSTTRTVHVLYAADNSLTVLYYDSFFADLFKVTKDHPDVPQSLPEYPMVPQEKSEE